MKRSHLIVLFDFSYFLGNKIVVCLVFLNESRILGRNIGAAKCQEIVYFISCFEEHTPNGRIGDTFIDERHWSHVKPD